MSYSSHRTVLRSQIKFVVYSLSTNSMSNTHDTLLYTLPLYILYSWLYGCIQGSTHHLTCDITLQPHFTPYSLHPPRIPLHTSYPMLLLHLSIPISTPILNKASCGDVGGTPSQAEKSSTALAPGLSQRLSQTRDPHLKPWTVPSSLDGVYLGLYSEQDRYTRYGAFTAES